jgi:hypothetical protein
MDEPSIVCTLTERELRERREGLLRAVRERVLAARRLPADPAEPTTAAAGLEVRFPGDDATLAAVLEVVRLESRCCAFLRFRVTVEPGGAAVVLEISGPPGGAELLADELAPQLF